jgi:hypothetical protein
MAGCGDEVAVAGVKIEVLQGFECGEWIGHGPLHAGADQPVDLIQ